MPPALGDDEHDTVRSLRLNSGDVSFSGMLESLDEEQTARTCWDIMYGGGGATASTGEQRTGNVVMAPLVEQAVLVQAYAQLQKAGSSSLTPFHHAAAMYVDMQRLCGGVSMPNFNDCLLHALLVVFTLVSLETRPERPPPAYNRDLVTAPLRKAFTIVTSCNLPSGGLFALQDLVVARLSPTVRLDITFYDAGPYIETVVKRV
ncbi:hypothetical protein DMC30DRAFT_387075 [Rhodotorula diobovata]|uniref:Uncharacterized protein n=1 Tax=Rhodotorula diobovata TaxID=5288 RepID=A0A5C5G7F1_9BASI|nr:hypothetical protein DMC30DRAFT_387075 [Rhodotorula diobovata]